jgi:Protein of unknown function (DUF2510)
VTAPGWYDEPGGDRASLRWWDGRSWTSVTRARSPGEELPPHPAGTDVLDSGDGRPPAGRRAWLVAGVAVAIVLALVTLGVPGRRNDTGGLADGGPAVTSIVPQQPDPTTATPVTGRYSDRVARLSYDVLPGDWREWDRDSFHGLQSTLGYYRVTQENAPGGQTYWANVNSGVVTSDVADGTLAVVARRLISTLATDYYPEHRREGLTQRAVKVDGADAALISYRAVFDPTAAAGYSAKSEQIVVLVVDTGEAQPSALYVSLPDTVRDLWPSIDGLVGSVRIIR